MKVNKLTLKNIFDTTVRLEAPLFQRPYVWGQEKNWEPLMEAIISLASSGGRIPIRGPISWGQLFWSD